MKCNWACNLMNDETKSDDRVVRVRFVESPEKYNYRLSIGRMFYYRFPYLTLNPFKSVCAMARIVQLLGTSRSNDATATRTSLEK